MRGLQKQQGVTLLSGTTRTPTAPASTPSPSPAFPVLAGDQKWGWARFAFGDSSNDNSELVRRLRCNAQPTPAMQRTTTCACHATNACLPIDDASRSAAPELLRSSPSRSLAPHTRRRRVPHASPLSSGTCRSRTSPMRCRPTKFQGCASSARPPCAGPIAVLPRAPGPEAPLLNGCRQVTDAYVLTSKAAPLLSVALWTLVASVLAAAAGRL